MIGRSLFEKLFARHAKTPSEAHLRMIDNWRSSAIETVLEEASEILGNTSLPTDLRELARDFLREQNIERSIEPKIEHLAAFVPDIKTAMKKPFLSAPSTGPFPFLNMVAPAIAGLNGVDPDDQTFQDRIRWGVGAHRQMVFLRQLSAKLNVKSPASRTALEKSALELFRTLDSTFVPPEQAQIVADIEDGRSVFLVHAHAGMSTVFNIGLPIGEIPLSVLAIMSQPAIRPQDFHMATIGNRVAVDFAKLMKLMKKSARIVRIFSDGPHGEMMKGSVCGRDIEIGRGTAVLAHAGKASVYFCGSRWTGRAFEFYLIPGPKGDAYPSRSAFEAAFTEFYCSCLEKIALGPPEDMAPNGGFWTFLRN